MKAPNYWKNYLYETDAEEIERNLGRTSFKSSGLNLSLKYFEKDRNAPNILLISSTGCYSLLGTEMMYEMDCTPMIGQKRLGGVGGVGH